MKNLITEARELCVQFETEEAPVSECMECISLEMKNKLLELCDALEKAERESGCEWCELHSVMSIMFDDEPFGFCPKCGRKLDEKGEEK